VTVAERATQTITRTNMFPGKNPAPSNSPLLRSVRAGKVRKLAKRIVERTFNTAKKNG